MDLYDTIIVGGGIAGLYTAHLLQKQNKRTGVVGSDTGGKGADSASLEKTFLHPFPEMPLYICGEHYSADSQQWIEGALLTAKKVVERIVQ